MNRTGAASMERVPLVDGIVAEYYWVFQFHLDLVKHCVKPRPQERLLLAQCAVGFELGAHKDGVARIPTATGLAVPVLAGMMTPP